MTAFCFNEWMKMLTFGFSFCNFDLKMCALVSVPDCHDFHFLNSDYKLQLQPVVLIFRTPIPGRGMDQERK